MGDEILDELNVEEQAAASGTGEENVAVQHQVDRGDFLGDEETLKDDAGDTAKNAEPLSDASTAAGAGDTDIKAVSTIAEIGEEESQPAATGMPYARANEISREKNAALDLATALIDGTIDKRWVADMGGQQAVVKGIAAGKILLPRTGVSEQGEKQSSVPPEIAKLEDQLDALNDKLVEATIDVNIDDIKAIQKQINTINRQIFKTESQLERSAEIEQSRQEAARQDEAKVQTVMVDLWDKHPELHSDTNEYLAFMARRDNHLRSGKPMSEALTLAAGETFTQNTNESESKIPEQLAMDRVKKAREKAASAKKQQPPAGSSGAGYRATESTKSIERMSDAEFDKLDKEEKARARGDSL